MDDSVFLCPDDIVLCFVQSAVGHEYQSQLSKHCSQTDNAKGFGGKYGVQSDRVDQVFPISDHLLKTSNVGMNFSRRRRRSSKQK